MAGHCSRQAANVWSKAALVPGLHTLRYWLSVCLSASDKLPSLHVTKPLPTLCRHSSSVWSVFLVVSNFQQAHDIGCLFFLQSQLAQSSGSFSRGSFAACPEYWVPKNANLDPNPSCLSDTLPFACLRTKEKMKSELDRSQMPNGLPLAFQFAVV